MDIVLATPSAGPVIYALRSIGYNPRTAVADLIDNSIDARASKIHLDFQYNEGNGYIQIIDNGFGMDGKEIKIAMAIGSKDPRTNRQENELGRFGMGLKTASFSLGKRLSVISWQGDKIVERCWDLDHVSGTNEWELFTQVPDEVKEKIKKQDSPSGTIVFIDKLDRFMRAGSKPIISNSFNRKVEKIQEHIAFVFHSLIEKDLDIFVNRNAVEPWEPFLSSHDYTNPLRPRFLRDGAGKVVVSPYVMPHASYFNQVDYKNAGGFKGWRDHQGFYIYRENRLLYFGDWLDLFPKDQASQLARIRVDITNASDEAWQVDIKKSTVSPPETIKNQLKSIAKEVREMSKQVFYFRTQSGTANSKVKYNVNTWRQESDDHGTTFKLNRSHPLLGKVMDQLEDPALKGLQMYLKLVELGSPANIIAVPKVEEEKIQLIDERDKEMILQLAEMYSSLTDTKEGGKLADIILMTPSMERFNRYTIINTIKESFTNG